jgi:hypothetical protein
MYVVAYIVVMIVVEFSLLHVRIISLFPKILVKFMKIKDRIIYSFYQSFCYKYYYTIVCFCYFYSFYISATPSASDEHVEIVRSFVY